VSQSGKTHRPTGAPPRGEQLTRLIEQARSPDRGNRDEAFSELYRYVAGPMKELIARCVSRRSGPHVPVTEALNDAVATLFVRWSDLQVEDTGHFRALVVQAVYWKVTAQRRANRRLFEALRFDAASDAPAAPETGADFHAQDKFEEAVEALAEHELAGRDVGTSVAGVPTPLADVVKARHLIGLDAGAAAGPVPTFDAIGQMLGITAAAACKRYWKALEWLHERFPSVVPALPERKKAGRKKGAGGNGGDR
jgi:hypothetical protein